METRQLGRSEVRVSAVAFGAWAIGGWKWGGTDRKRSVEAIRAAIDSGITTIDTAPVYGQGLSEEIVGEAVKGLDRDRVQILTKFGLRWDVKEGEFFFESTGDDGGTVEIYRYAGPESVVYECERSLERLGVDHVDLLQLHWPDPTTRIEDTMLALAQLVDQGKVRAAGVSNFSADQMHEAEETISLASNQVPYSMLGRGIEKDVVPYCLEKGNAILAYSPLERGLLTGKFSPEHQFAPGDHRADLPFYRPENIRKVNAFLGSISPIAEAHNATLAQLVIAWTIAQPGITVALVGARDREQAEANAKGGEIALTPEEIAEINGKIPGLEGV